jgi:transposase-like protein
LPEGSGSFPEGSEKLPECHVLPQVDKKEGENMTKSKRTYYRYSNCFKEKVVREVSSGSGISSASLKYGIRGAGTVQGRIKKFGQEELLNTAVRIRMKGETDGIGRLREENRRQMQR